MPEIPSHLTWLLDQRTKNDFMEAGEFHKSQILLAQRVDSLGEKVILAKKNFRDAGQYVLVFTFFLRIQNAHKAIIREALLGYWIEAECIARPMFEALIHLYELVSNESFVDTYIKSQNILRRTLIKRSIEDSQRSEPQLKHVDVDLHKALEEINQEGNSGFDIRKLAEKHGLLMLHDQVISYYHNSVHVKPNSMHLYLGIENESIKGIYDRPVISHPDELLGTVVLTLADAIRKTIHFFKLQDLEDEANEIWTLITNLKSSSK